MSRGSFTDVKSVHERGIISIACDKTKSSSQFLTCGTDGTIYVWDENALLGNDSPSIKNIGDATHSCIAWTGPNVYVGYTTTDLITGVDKKVIGRGGLSNLETPTQILSFSLEATSVDAGEKYVVAGASDFSVKIFDNETGKLVDRIERYGAILDVVIDSKEQLFAVSSTDGSIAVYKLPSCELVKEFPNIFPQFGSIEVDKSRHLLAWSGNGDFLYVPARGSIRVINTSDWTISEKSFIAPGSETDSFSTICISACGEYLVSSTLTNKLCVFSILSRELVSSTEYKRIAQGKNIVTSIAVSPFDNRSVIVADANEGLSMWKNALPAPINVTGDHNSKINKARKASRSRGVQSDDEEEGSEQSIHNKNDFLLNDEAEEIDGEEEQDGDTRMSTDIGAIKRNFNFNNEGNTILDDFGFGTDAPSNFNDAHNPVSAAPTAITKIVEYEPPSIPLQFVSGASPTHQKQRYLKWNSYGVIRSFNNEEENNLEIEFHDASIHSEIIMDNSATNYVIGDLSDQAVALATTPDDKNQQSELLVIHITSWDPESRRWSTKLPINDYAVDVLVSRELIAVVTEQRNIRIFTLAGTQRHVIAHPGPILTSSCFDYKIAMASVSGGEYHEERRGHSKTKSQYQFNATVYDLHPKTWYRSSSVVTTVSIPVAPGKKLDWLGHTNEGQLVSMDSGFTVRLLAPGGFWMPVIEGSSELKAKTDAVWPIAVIEGRQQQFRYLYLKGTKHPQIATKMSPIIAPWLLPFCQPESEKTKLEAALIWNELRQSEVYSTSNVVDMHELNSSHLQSLVKLFALACKSERETRASELARFVSSSKGIQVMCNYAAAMKKQILSDKVADIGRENVSAEEPSARPNDAFSDRIAPRRVSLNRRKMGSVSAPIEVEPIDDEEPEEGDDPSDMTRNVMDMSVCSEQTQIPVSQKTRNPFKRAAEIAQEMDTSSVSVFDQLESSFDNPRKKNRDDVSQKILPVKKQAKLSFGGSAATPKGKENGGVTAYSMWLSESEGNMKKMFSGDADEFEKFCMGQYRMLPPAQKKEWKARAETASD